MANKTFPRVAYTINNISTS